MLKPLTAWITTNCRKFLKRWEHQTTLPASWETCMQVKKQQLEPDMEQWTSSKLGKKYIKAVYFHPAHLTYTQSTSCKMLGYMNYKLESDGQDKYQQPQIYWWWHSNGRKLRGTKQPLDKGERGKWKKLASNPTFKKLRSWHPASSLNGKRGRSGNSDRFYFLGLQNHCGWLL